MEQDKWTIDELEAIYLTEYDEDDLPEIDCGDDVQNFLTWCRCNIAHVN